MSASIAVLQTGVGAVNAAHAVTLFLATTGARQIVVCGVGGAYPDSGLRVGDVLCAERECYGDLGAMSPSGFLDMKALGFPIVDGAPPLYNELPMQIFPVRQRAPFVPSLLHGATNRPLDRSADTRLGRKHGMGGNRTRPHLHQLPVGEGTGISNIVTTRDTKAWRLDEAAAARRRRSRMDRQPLNFGFSSCPNDTFAFHALVHGIVMGPAIIPHIDDVEALNTRAERGEAEVTKISIGAYNRVRHRYSLLRAGGAAGFGVGPIVVARMQRAVGGRIAIPGERTTAALLLRLLGRFETVSMRFDEIEQAVASGRVDCGVLIHEGRFTYESKGLTLLADLGAVWEERMCCPLPLAAIASRRDLADVRGADVDRGLRASVEYAFAHPEASREYVAMHAQEMDPEVVAKHIKLYVNEYTLALNERAVLTMLRWAEEQTPNSHVRSDLPVFLQG